MVSQHVARVLLAVAVRRWPVRLREDLRQEWAAELHVLAEERRHARMLRYALSLAIARPARRSVPVGTLLTGAWRVARFVLVAPLIAMALLIAAFVASNLIVEGVTDVRPDIPPDFQDPMTALLTLGCAVPLARLGRRWAPAGAPAVLLLLAVTAPGFLLSVLTQATGHHSGARVAADALFFLGLGTVLAAVARLARAGRGRAAWWTGIVGALIAGDIAVMLPVLTANLPPEETPALASAPVWLFTALTGSGFGLPDLTGLDILSIVDKIELDPFLYLAFTALALGAVIAAARRVTPAGRDVAVRRGAGTSPGRR